MSGIISFRSSVKVTLPSVDYKVDDTGIGMVYRQSGGIAPGYELIVKEIEAFTSLSALHLMVNRLSPENKIPEHRDWLKDSPLQGKHPCLQRWHLCLGDSFWWDEVYGVTEMRTGYWYGPMPYWKLHRVYTLVTRVNVIVDLDTVVRLGDYD